MYMQHLGNHVRVLEFMLVTTAVVHVEPCMETERVCLVHHRRKRGKFLGVNNWITIGRVERTIHPRATFLPPEIAIAGFKHVSNLLMEKFVIPE